MDLWKRSLTVLPTASCSYALGLLLYSVCHTDGSLQRWVLFVVWKACARSVCLQQAASNILPTWYVFARLFSANKNTTAAFDCTAVGGPFPELTVYTCTAFPVICVMYRMYHSGCVLYPESTIHILCTYGLCIAWRYIILKRAKPHCLVWNISVCTHVHNLCAKCPSSFPPLCTSCTKRKKWMFSPYQLHGFK